jgi:hypothetical protein
MAGVALPTVSRVQPAPNKAQEMQRVHPRTFAGVVLPKVPEVKLGGQGEMPSTVTGPSQRRDASDDVDIEMSAPEPTKVDKGKGRLIKVDPAAEQEHVPKKRKIENVSGKSSGPKSSMKKREKTSADPDKGSVTPTASYPMPVNLANANSRVQDAMQMGNLHSRDDGGSVSAICHAMCASINRHRSPDDWHRQPIAQWEQACGQPQQRIFMYR